MITQKTAEVCQYRSNQISTMRSETDGADANTYGYSMVISSPTKGTRKTHTLNITPAELEMIRLIMAKGV